MEIKFPALFYKEENGYSIFFPDIDEAYTGAQTIMSGIEMAEDVLRMTLEYYNEIGKKIPIPSSIQEIKLEQNSTVVFISCVI